MLNSNKIRKLLTAVAVVFVTCLIMAGCGKNRNELTAPTHFTVTFQDYDGTVLKSEEIPAGEAANAPEAPQREGYIFAGWNMDFSEICEDKVIMAEYIRVTDVALEVANITTEAGVDNVYVSVSVTNNPGILGALFSVSYNDQVMTLVDSIEGKSFPSLTFQPPSNYDSGCNFVLYGSETGEVTDGELLTLVFSVAEDAPEGTYPITLSCGDRDVYDANCDLLQPVLKEGSITVAGNNTQTDS